MEREKHEGYGYEGKNGAGPLCLEDWRNITRRLTHASVDA